jgi:peptidyl-dipeptidase A
LEQARSALLVNDRVWAMLRRWESGPGDALLARRITLLLRRLRWAEIESHPEVYQLRNRNDREIVGFRPQVAGVPLSRVERSEILRRHPGRDRRREAWLSTTSLADQVEAGVRQLMRWRQNLAREQGYDDYVSWALETIGLSRRWVESFFDELLRLTDVPYRAWLVEASQRLSLQDGLRPWDLAYVAEQGMSLPEAAFPRDGSLPAVQAVAEGLELGEAAAGVRVDVADIPYAALCYAVRPPDDVRILISPRDGRAHYDILFHEFGHALHWRCLRPRSPVLRRESPPFNEAMAGLWERLILEPEWLIERDVIKADRVADYRRGWAQRALYRLRLRVAQATFEYRAYRALDDDLKALFRDVFTQFMGVPYDEAPGWADSPFWTSHPVYLQNYVIGEAAASQSLAALRRRFGRLIGRPEVGAWLAEHYYAPGAGVSWTEKIVRATGASLGTADLAVDLGCEVKEATREFDPRG